MNNIISGNRCGKNYSEWIIVGNVELTYGQRIIDLVSYLEWRKG